MEGAGGYGHGVDEHVEAVLADGARHEVCAEEAGALRGHGGGHGRAVGPCSAPRVSSPPRPTLPHSTTTTMLAVRAKRMSLSK